MINQILVQLLSKDTKSSKHHHMLILKNRLMYDKKIKNQAMKWINQIMSLKKQWKEKSINKKKKKKSKKLLPEDALRKLLSNYCEI